MSSQAVWVVIESVNPIQIPVITYDKPSSTKRNVMIDQETNHIWPEPQNFIKLNNFIPNQSLNNIRLVGIYTNVEQAMSVVGCSPNRKLLGPSVIL